MFKRRLLFFVLLAALVLSATGTALGARPIPSGATYSFLQEMAVSEPIQGFPPALFSPENQPSHFEIAYFLFQLDKRLADIAHDHGDDLVGVFHRIRLAAAPGEGEAQAAQWAGQAAQTYRRLLIDYYVDLNAMGYQLNEDAYPAWCGSEGYDPGD